MKTFGGSKAKYVLRAGAEGFPLSSRQDLSKLRDEIKEKEILKEAEAKKRGMALACTASRPRIDPLVEKIEEAKARAAVKAQIEADKKARAEKAAREKALREGKAFPDAGPATPAPAAKPAQPGPSKDYKETRIQIRFASGGSPITNTLPSDSRKYYRFARLPRLTDSYASLAGCCRISGRAGPGHRC
jgi:hypothetical protein